MNLLIRKIELHMPKVAKITLFSLFFLACLGIFAAYISMLFGKPIGDDYGGIATYKLNLDWFKEALLSLTTTGRYGQSITATSAYALFGNSIVVLLPLIILFWLTGICFLYVKKALSYHIIDSTVLNLYSLIFTSLTVFLILFVNRSPETINDPVWASFQLFFWPSGIITYTLPLLALLTGIYILFLSKYTTTRKFVFFAITIYTTSLFNEIQPAFLVLLSALLLAASYSPTLKNILSNRKIFLITAATATLGLLTLFFSPGRIARSSSISASQPVEGSILEGLARNTTFLINNLYFRPRDIILMVLIGFTTAIIVNSFIKNKLRYKTIIKKLTPLVVLAVILFITTIALSISFVLIGYGHTAGIYPRTLAISQTLYALLIPFIAYIFFSYLLLNKKQFTYILASIMYSTAIIGTLLSLNNYSDKIMMQVKSSVDYSNAWHDQNSILIKASQNQTKETIHLDRPANGIGDGFSLSCSGPYSSSTIWLNEVISDYYGGQDAICAKETP